MILFTHKVKLLKVFKKKKELEKRDLVVLLVWPVFASVLSSVLKLNFMGSIILFFLLPSIYLSIRSPKNVKESLKFASLALIFIGPIDYAAGVSGQWWIPNSILPIRLGGIVTLENTLWAFLYVYLVTIFYKHFLDKSVSNHVDKNKHTRRCTLVAVYIFIALLALLMGLIYPYAIDISYYYLLAGILFVVVPIVLIETKAPNVITKFFKATAYFFYLSLLYEITALKKVWWLFPETGRFVGLVTMAGVQFPLEEFLFWICLGTMALLSFYEYYDDLT